MKKNTLMVVSALIILVLLFFAYNIYTNVRFDLPEYSSGKKDIFGLHYGGWLPGPECENEISDKASALECLKAVYGQGEQGLDYTVDDIIVKDGIVPLFVYYNMVLLSKPEKLYTSDKHVVKYCQNPIAVDKSGKTYWILSCLH